jgi:signal transduction histidine kinase
MHPCTRLAAAAALCLSALAAQAETVDAAKALLDSALTEIKAHGLDKAVKDFNAGGKWNKGSLYLVVAKFDGTMVAHSANDKIPGKNMFEAKDAGGKPFVQEAIATAKGAGAGEVALRWGNPATKQIADATMIIRRVPGQDVYLGSVVFK